MENVHHVNHEENVHISYIINDTNLNNSLTKTIPCNILEEILNERIQ